MSPSCLRLREDRAPLKQSTTSSTEESCAFSRNCWIGLLVTRLISVHCSARKAQGDSGRRERWWRWFQSRLTITGVGTELLKAMPIRKPSFNLTGAFLTLGGLICCNASMSHHEISSYGFVFIQHLRVHMLSDMTYSSAHTSAFVQRR